MTQNITSTEWATRATISNNTRRLLIAWGKLQDAADEYAGLISEQYEYTADKMLEKFREGIAISSNEMLNTIPLFVVESHGSKSDNVEI